MKNKLRYLICLLAFLLLTACGGVVDTKMSFDDSFAGSRVIKYSVTNADFVSYVQKDFGTVESTLRGLCPQDMEITSVEQNDSHVVAVFTINFTSKEDYEKKVANILSASGSDIIPTVTFVRADTVFAKGVAYQENFGSDDLLKWMGDGIISNDFVTSSYESYIFSSNYVSLSINGDDYEKDASMSILDVSNAKYLPINNVDFTTYINKDGSIDRTIELNIPDSTFNEGKDEIEKFVKERVGSIGTGTWVTKDSSHIFTIEGKGLSSDECKQMTEKFTGKSEYSEFSFSGNQADAVNESKSGEETESSTESDEATQTIQIDKGHLFAKNYLLTENIDLEDYISNSDNSVRFNYYMNSENDYEGSVIDASFNTDSFSSDARVGSSNVLLFNGYSSTFDIDVKISILPDVSKYRHIVDITPDGKIKRNINVVFKDSFTEDDVKEIEDRLKTVFNDTKVKLDKIALKNNDLEVKISSIGTIDEDMKMWEEATGNVRYSGYLDIDKKGYLSLKQTIYFTDDFDPVMFTSGNVEKYEYRVKNAGKPVDKNGYFGGSFDSAEAKFKGNDFVVKGENLIMANHMTIDFISVRTNYIIFIVLAAIFAVVILVAVVAVLLLIKKNKKKSAQIQDINAAGSEKSAAVADDIISDTVFCPHCGTKNNYGDKFCSSCGKEIS